MDDPAFGGIKNSECEWAAVLADLFGGKTGHRVKLGLARLPKAFGVDHKAVFAVDLTAKSLKKHDLERIE